MFFWNINKILDSIRNDEFSEFDKLKYYILSTLIIMTIAFETFDFTSYTGTIKIFSMVSTTVIGMLYLYNKNKQYDGRHFIERTIIFQVPMFFRITLMAMPIGFALGMFLAVNGYVEILNSKYFRLTITVVFTIISIIWEGNWFSRLSESDITDTENEM
jgi:uncharacterized membrane protein